jgi:hypothetical protein
MSRVGFEPTIPVFDRAKTFHVLDRAATVIGQEYHYILRNCELWLRETRVKCVETRALLAACFTLVSCLAYSSTLKIEATYSSEMSVGFQRNIQVYISEDRKFHYCIISVQFKHLQHFVPKSLCVWKTLWNRTVTGSLLFYVRHRMLHDGDSSLVLVSRRETSQGNGSCGYSVLMCNYERHFHLIWEGTLGFSFVSKPTRLALRRGKCS